MRFFNFSALRGQKGTDNSFAIVECGLTKGDLMGGLFLYDSTSVLVDDNKKVIKNASWSVGAWIKSEPLTMKRGVASFTWTLGQTSYSFPHGLPSTPMSVVYSFQAATPLLLGSTWSADATNITISFLSIGTVGNTFKIPWVAFID